MGVVAESTGELGINVGGALQEEAWLGYGGVRAAADVVVAMAGVIVEDGRKSEEDLSPDLRLARMEALIAAADTLSLGAALRIIINNPTLSEEGRELSETTGDDPDDARRAAYTLSVISAIDSQTTVSRHNLQRITSYAADPVLDVLNRANLV